MIKALYFLFVLSGAAGLIYESIWTRYLGLFVGHDAYAQIIVLVIFLGGMSLGAVADQPAVGTADANRSMDMWRSSSRWDASASSFTTSFRPSPAGPTPDLSGARRLEGSGSGQVGHRRQPDPAAVGAAGHDLSADDALACSGCAAGGRAGRSPCCTSRTAWARRSACSSRASTW